MPARRSPVDSSDASSLTRADEVCSALSDWQEDGGQNLAVPVPSPGEINRWRPSAKLCVSSYRRRRAGGTS